MEKRKHLLLFLVSFVFVTLFSRSTSFLYVFEGADPSIFKQMGLALLKGKTPYIDYFDNKGFLLYLIHALGLWLGGDFFILLMQALSLTITLVIWDTMLALYKSQRQRNICLGIALLMLACFYGAGDQTQEWCLPFISYPLLVFVRANKNHSEPRPWQMLLTGLCFGVITFIQINNACAFLGFVAYLWIQHLLHKDFGNLFRNLGCFMEGWLLIALPCLLYFYVKAGSHGIYEMVYATFLSNLEYIGIQPHTLWFHWLPYLLFVFSLLLIQLINGGKEKNLLVPFLISMICFLGTFGKLFNSFYLIAILPLVVISMLHFNLKEHKKAKIGLLLTALGSVLFMGSIGAFHIVNDLILQSEKEVKIYEDFHHCVENIPENEKDSIFNYNLFWHGYGMMQHEGLLQCNRVSLVFNLPTLMKEEQAKPFRKPLWILISFNMRCFAEDVAFIQDHYDLCCEFRYDRLYLRKPLIGNEFQVCLYRRKSK